MNTTTTVAQPQTQPKRYIGIRPRVKVTAKGDAHPTQVAILIGGETIRFDLQSERHELDFIIGKLPVGGRFRDVLPDEDLSQYLAHHVIHDDPEKARKEERPLKPIQVPVGYVGLMSGDLVATSLGGLGDCISYAISRFGEEHGFNILRLPPFRLKDARGSASEDDDALLLATLVREKPELFRSMAKRDRALVKLREETRLRRFVQEGRKACDMRVRASELGKIFCSEEGGFPEGDIEKLFDLAIASDPVAIAIKAKERELNRQVEDAIEMLPIYSEVLAKIEGVGPQTMAPVLSAIQDVGLFDTVGKFKAFCGLHVNRDGSFPRKRRGERCNWNTSARQAFFNLVTISFTYLKGCFWGLRLRENKVMYRAAHPYAVLVEGTYQKKGTDRVFVPTGREFDLIDGKWKKDPKKGYVIQHESGEIVTSGKLDFTKAHIHKMAVWRTVSEFAEWLYWKWRGMEGYDARPPRAFPPEDAAAVAETAVEWEKTHPSPKVNPGSGASPRASALLPVSEVPREERAEPVTV